jgi:hypothetical protein
MAEQSANWVSGDFGREVEERAIDMEWVLSH